MAAISTASQLACTVSATGITAPSFADIQAYLQTSYRDIYGSDVVLDNSTQDGQWIGIIAQALNASNSATIAAWNKFSPATAVGVGLSSVVKINGIAREIASYSTVDVTLSASAGQAPVITNGSVKDNNGYVWTLPATVMIPTSGSVTVTATCTTIGAIGAGIGTVTTINTPTLGWASVTNMSAAAVGSPVETDATLRVRQTKSTMLPSTSVLDGIIGAIAALDGVTSVAGYENDSDTTDANGIPANSTSLVVEGGDASAIATIIANKKTMGSPTYGTTSETVTDSYGNSQTINFYRPTNVEITGTIALKALTGYTDAIGTGIATAVAAYIQSQSIGSTIYTTRLYAPATLQQADGGLTYDLTSIQIARNAASPSTANIDLAFYEIPVSTASDFTVSASA